MKTIQFLFLFLLTVGCQKTNEEEQIPSSSTLSDLNPVGTWDVTYFKHRDYSVGARFEAPKGLTMTFFNDSTFITHKIPHIITVENLSGKYYLNKAKKTIIISETKYSSQPKMFVDNVFSRITGRLIFLDGTAFVAEYELVKRN